MPCPSINILSKKSGDRRVPLFRAPYTALDTVQNFLANSFNALLWEASALAPDNIFMSGLATRLCTPLLKFDTLYGGISGGPWLGGTSDAMVGTTLCAVVNDGRGGGGQVGNLAFKIQAPATASGTLTLSSQGEQVDTTAISGLILANAACAPIFAMVQVATSPPMFMPCVYFSAWGKDVISQNFIYTMFNPQQAGPTTGIYNGPTVPGGIAGNLILPQTFSVSVASDFSLDYSDASLNIFNFDAHLPDIDGRMNRWIGKGGAGQFRIVNFLQGFKAPQSILKNHDGSQAFISFDDATIDAGILASGVTCQATRKGFLLKANAAYKGQTPIVILLSPDGSSYETLLFQPQDAGAVDALSTGIDSSFAVDANGLLYVKKFNSSVLANSFGIGPTFSTPIGGAILPVGLPCFEPCFPWPTA